jgi:ATP-dependent DNA ligase
VFLYAFDLIALNRDDLRREPLKVRKATLASVLAKAADGLRLNEHIEHETAKPYFATPARWGWRALSLSAGTPESVRAFARKMKNPARK